MLIVMCETSFGYINEFMLYLEIRLKKAIIIVFVPLYKGLYL